jgi:transposase
MDISVLGIDLGKNVCSVVGLDASGAVVIRRRMKRETLIGLAEKLPACIVGMEASCGSHHLGRVLASHGHDVRLCLLNMFDPTSRRRRTTIATLRGSRRRRRDQRCALSN